jgi:hypothetical protein
MEYFGINRLSDLPKLKEINEIIASDPGLGEQMAVFDFESSKEEKLDSKTEDIKVD